MISPRIGVSMGCPAGIGPEVIVRALAARPTLDVTVFGDEGVLSRAAARIGLSLPKRVAVVPVTQLGEDEAQPGEPSEITGSAQLDYLAAAADAVVGGKVSALVTAPISRDWAARAGRPFASHMEYLSNRVGAKECATMQIGG